MPKTPGLRELRKRATLTQGELAKASGISRATIADLEAGNRGAWPRTIRKLAKALHAEPVDLYAEPDSPKAHSPFTPFTAERALNLADPDTVRLEAKHASVRELDQAARVLARYTKPQSIENPSSPEATHRRVIAHERLGILQGELEMRGVPSPVAIVLNRLDDALDDAEEPGASEGREAG